MAGRGRRVARARRRRALGPDRHRRHARAVRRVPRPARDRDARRAGRAPGAHGPGARRRSSSVATAWPASSTRASRATPSAAVAERILDHGGAMLSVDLAGGREPRARRSSTPSRSRSGPPAWAASTRWSSTRRRRRHRSLDAASLAAAGITEGLLRVSVGLEDEADLVADFGQALDAANAASRAPDPDRGQADAGRHRVGRPPSRPSPPGGRRHVPRRASRRGSPTPSGAC